MKRDIEYSSLRVIEKEMMKAIHSRVSWRKDNTEVTKYKDRIEVRLFGNLIATITFPGSGTVIKLSDGGYERTVTTKSRLNALLFYTEHCIYQKDWIWYFADNQYFTNGLTLPFKSC